MLKAEFHAHTDEDPADRIPHTTGELIDHAVSLGYRALAVTLHDRYFHPEPWNAYARSRGLVLLAGIERTVGGHHVLLINFPPACASAASFDEIARFKASCRGLVVAPHPFYPTSSAMGSALDRHADVIDALEVNALYTRWIDFNRRAVSWALAHGKPLVGNSDVHLLDQMGTTYSLVDAEPEPDAICDAIRRGRVSVRAKPLSGARAAAIFSRMLVGGLRGRLQRSGR